MIFPSRIDVAAAGRSAQDRRTAERAADAGQVANIDQAVIVGIASRQARLGRGKGFKRLQVFGRTVPQVQAVGCIQLVVRAARQAP